jgi:hypothetical protein
MTVLGIILVTLGLAMTCMSRVTSTPPLLYLGLPGIVIALIGLAILGSAGVNVGDYLPKD